MVKAVIMLFSLVNLNIHLSEDTFHPDMPERDLHPTPRRPEPLVLTAQDLDLLQAILSAEELRQFQQANRGELLCLACEQPLLGMVMIAEEYEGLTLVCLGCGYCEY